MLMCAGYNDLSCDIAISSPNINIAKGEGEVVKENTTGTF